MSVVVNAILLGVVFTLLRESPPSVLVVETNAPLKIVERQVEVKVEVPEPFDWRKVESPDYREYIANLRSLGCPEQTVRDIIVADVNALFDMRRRAAVEPQTQYEFWKPDALPAFSSHPAEQIRERFEQLRKLADEKRLVLRELLGIEWTERMDATFSPLNPREQLLTFLPMEKRLKVEEIEQRFSAMLMRRTTDASGREQLGNFKRLQVEKRAELEKILSTEELADYDLRLSPAAATLRSKLGSVNVSEAEFREMVGIRRKFDEEFGGLVGIDAADQAARERREMAQQKMDDQLLRILGRQRFADFQRKQDWAYHGAVLAAARSGLPNEAAEGVYEMKQIAEAEVQRVRGDAGLPPEERRRILNDMRTAVEESVLKVLGKEGYDAYQKQPGSSWLRSLNQSEPKGGAGRR